MDGIFESGVRLRWRTYSASSRMVRLLLDSRCVLAEIHGFPRPTSIRQRYYQRRSYTALGPRECHRIQPSSHLKKDVLEYGAGAGTGAVVGAKIAGVHGAVIGSLVGAGVITAHMLMQHPEIAEVPKGSVVTFSLTEPMDLMPTRN